VITLFMLVINFNTGQSLMVAQPEGIEKEDVRLIKVDSKFHQEEKTRNLIITAIVILLILPWILYVYFLSKQLVKRSFNAKYSRMKSIYKMLVLEKKHLLAEKEDLLLEKEWMLNEIHHRVKNNLHTVICLLESQAVYLNGDALGAIKKSQHRIYAILLIHKRLYQIENIKTVDVSAFIEEFNSYLVDSYSSPCEIQYQFDIQPVNLEVTQAIPLSLIINEAVSNSIQHAFLHQKSGIIMITMHQYIDEITLVIADDGSGIDNAIIDRPAETLGLMLMTGLSQDLNADFKIENKQGTRIIITFNSYPIDQNEGFKKSTR
jgi:two-component sensor histidine kinase